MENIKNWVLGIWNGVSTFFSKAISKQGIFWSIALVILVVADIVLLVRVGGFTYIFETLKFIYTLLVAHLLATLLVAGSVVLILIIIRKLRALK